MALKVIGVPVDGDLLESLNSVSKREGPSRSELIRQACRYYLNRLEEARLDRIYEEGYRRVPEDPALGEAQIAMLAEVLPEEG